MEANLVTPWSDHVGWGYECPPDRAPEGEVSIDCEQYKNIGPNGDDAPRTLGYFKNNI